jgi:hypothetical protein
MPWLRRSWVSLVLHIYRITSIKGARRGSISKRGALNRIKSSIIQSAYKVGDIRSLTKTGYSLSKALVFFTFADPFLRS